MDSRRVLGAGLAGLLVAALAAGCSSSGDGSDGGDSSTSVLTGEPGAAGRVLAVKIDNVGAARPQTGLNSADLVYGIEVEGGLSRLMAVFDSDHLPGTIGPVRSARETDLQILAQYDRPALAFSGAQSKLLPVLEDSDIVARTGTSAFFRNPDRPAPHNEYIHPEGLTDGAGEAKDIGLRFAAKTPSGGTANTTTTASMPHARFTFTWDGKRYTVALDGGKSPWTTDNVIVQRVKVKESRFRSRTGFVPFSQTVGSGTGVVLRDGRSYAVRWSRPSDGAGTTYTREGGSGSGTTMRLHPGRTWIVLEPA
ncbi:DUF3048 domain-containing protein [Streptomyces liangshanensis]|uniref:DUF3048 domain-containing protein n=1 Tax=Streptomyces liangshanensis TaxID=2717324 RepID=A0A6G9GV53_9ACTN|nr:DUF3048 domain-containing protein [Streptomyces liangshanensis]QIQ02153.1 DUF3048 domain-containing protein [Streptomyces liangshanensis]